MKKLIMICMTVVFTSCGSIQTLTFDQLYPSEVNFPKAVGTIAVVNNMASMPSPAKGLPQTASLEGDGRKMAETVAGGLADSHYFSQVLICDSALRDKKAVPGSLKELSAGEVDHLAAQLGADAILSVDGLHILAHREKVAYEGYGLVNALSGQLRSVARIYYPQREGAALTVAKADTVFWELSPSLTEHQVVEDATTHAAQKLVQRLVPYWRTVNRLYYDDGSPDMRDAAVSVRENDWASAAESWKQAYDSRKRGNLKMHAAFNLALAAEMQGQVEDVTRWLDEAGRLARPGSTDAYAVAVYRNQWAHRKPMLARLNIQMGRFGNK